MNGHRVIRRMLRDETGIILPLVLVFLALGLLLITPALGHGYSALAGTSVTERKAEEMHAADSGVQAGIYWLIRGKPPQTVWTPVTEDEWVHDDYPLNATLVTVTVSTLVSNTYLVTSQATGENGSTTVLSKIWAVPFLEDGYEFKGDEFEGDFHIDGDGSIANNGTVTGNLTVDGDLEVKGAITGDNTKLSLTGDLILKTGGGTTITAEVICIGGDLLVSNPATINADIHFQGADCTFDAANTSATQDGKVFADGNLTINLSQNAVISTSGIYARGNVVVNIGSNKNAKLTGDIYAGGTVTINTGKGTYVGALHPYYTGPWPTPPDCPPWPVDPLQILSWEIT